LYNAKICLVICINNKENNKCYELCINIAFLQNDYTYIGVGGTMSIKGL